MSIERLLREKLERLRLDDDELLAERFLATHALRGQLAIGGRVGAELERGGIGLAHEALARRTVKVGDGFSPSRRAFPSAAAEPSR